MNTINLLPRKPFVEEYFVFLLISCALFIVMLGGAIGYVTIEANARSAETAERLHSARLAAETAASRLAPDETLRQYRMFERDVDRQRQASKDWMPLFDAVSRPLPTMARITEMSANADALLTAHYEFGGLEDIAAYIAALEADERTVSIGIQRLALEPYTYTPPPVQTNAPAAPERAESGGHAPDPGQAHVHAPAVVHSPIDRYLDSLRDKFPQPVTESEALLQKLEWEIEKKRALELYGVTLPDAPSELAVPAGPFDDPRYAVFSREELDEALRELEQFRMLRHDADAGVTPPPAVPVVGDELPIAGTSEDEPAVVHAADEERPQRFVYRATLDIQFATAALQG